MGHPALTKTFTTKTAAHAWATSQEGNLLDGAYHDTRKAERLTLSEALDRHFRTNVFPQKATSTQQSGRHKAITVRSLLGGHSLLAHLTSTALAWRSISLTRIRLGNAEPTKTRMAWCEDISRKAQTLEKPPKKHLHLP